MRRWTVPVVGGIVIIAFMLGTSAPAAAAPVAADPASFDTPAGTWPDTAFAWPGAAAPPAPMSTNLLCVAGLVKI